jgi:hypothetical protein
MGVMKVLGWLIHSFDCFAPAAPFLAPPIRGGRGEKKEVAKSGTISLVYGQICPTNGGKLIRQCHAACERCTSSQRCAHLYAAR